MPGKETAIDQDSDQSLHASTTTSRSQRADALRNRALVLEAARAVLQQDGLAAQMDDIAAHAGLGVGTLYRHFPTKDALIDTIVWERATQVLDAARAALEAADAWEGFAAFAWHMASLQAEDRALADILADDPGRFDFGRFSMELLAILSAVVTRAQAAGQMRVDVSAQEVFGVLCVTGQGGQHRGGHAPAFYRRFIAIMLDGLHARAAPTAEAY